MVVVVDVEVEVFLGGRGDCSRLVVEDGSLPTGVWCSGGCRGCV